MPRRAWEAIIESSRNIPSSIGFQTRIPRARGVYKRLCYTGNAWREADSATNPLRICIDGKLRKENILKPACCVRDVIAPGPENAARDEGPKLSGIHHWRLRPFQVGSERRRRQRQSGRRHT